MILPEAILKYFAEEPGLSIRSSSKSAKNSSFTFKKICKDVTWYYADVIHVTNNKNLFFINNLVNLKNTDIFHTTLT